MHIPKYPDLTEPSRNLEHTSKIFGCLMRHPWTSTDCWNCILAMSRLALHLIRVTRMQLLPSSSVWQHCKGTLCSRPLAVFSLHTLVVNRKHGLFVSVLLCIFYLNSLVTWFDFRCSEQTFQISASIRSSESIISCVCCLCWPGSNACRNNSHMDLIFRMYTALES
jgi:hypothetical protein